MAHETKENTGAANADAKRPVQRRVSCRDIVKEYLVANGYDGLYCDECSCLPDDLFPCGGSGGDWILDCTAGYKIDGCTCGEGCDFHTGPKCN